MRYEMRRKDRQISDNEAYAVLDKAPFGVMSTVDGDGIPYGVPLNFARSGLALYFHAANTGHKIDNLKERPDVCITFVGNVSFPEDNFTTAFESAIIFGRAEEVSGDTEKIQALKLISERFTPKNMAAFNAEIDKYPKLPAVWKITIQSISGKQRKYP
jgi:nitroimidazol reductase NimA-like FMN-containing flavoprotein (pyridoxamine 5'-phosphate oxidase superfamily)